MSLEEDALRQGELVMIMPFQEKTLGADVMCFSYGVLIKGLGITVFLMTLLCEGFAIDK